MEFFVIIYTLSFVFAIVSALGIGISVEVFDVDMVLKRKTDFIRCVFMWQFAVYELLNEEINTAGIVILEIITTALIFPENIIAFMCLLICLLFKGIAVAFYKIFRKRYKESEVSE